MIRQDEFGTVINHNDTFDAIAECLKANRSIVFAWTDEQGTQLDVTMMMNPDKYGPLGRGLRATDLFVGIVGFGAFGFAYNGSWKSPGYIGEKLSLGSLNPTTAELSELINGVCDRLEKPMD